MRKFTHGYSGIPFMKPNLEVCEFIFLMKQLYKLIAEPVQGKVPK